jgi:hypothetical protein
MAPKEMAESLKRSAEASTRRKTTSFRSAMSMLVFYQNRAGRTLSAKARKNIDRTKDELRRLYGKPTKSGR